MNKKMIIVIIAAVVIVTAAAAGFYKIALSPKSIPSDNHALIQEKGIILTKEDIKKIHDEYKDNKDIIIDEDESGEKSRSFIFSYEGKKALQEKAIFNATEKPLTVAYGIGYAKDVSEKNIEQIESSAKETNKSITEEDIREALKKSGPIAKYLADRINVEIKYDEYIKDDCRKYMTVTTIGQVRYYSIVWIQNKTVFVAEFDNKTGDIISRYLKDAKFWDISFEESGRLHHL